MRRSLPGASAFPSMRSSRQPIGLSAPPKMQSNDASEFPRDLQPNVRRRRLNESRRSTQAPGVAGDGPVCAEVAAALLPFHIAPTNLGRCPGGNDA